MDTHVPAPSSDRGRAEARWIRGAAIASGLLFLIRAVLFLYRSHPQDDAYILFGYVRRFVAGEGIVFYPGGPHAEGATDFLWFAALSLLHRLGLDIALSACLLNAAAGALLGGLLAGAIARSSASTTHRVLLLGLLAPAALAGGAIAAAIGFGSLFFSAAAAWALVLAVEAIEGGARAESAILAIPYVGLLLALIRPDGVVLGAAFVLVGAVSARRESCTRPFARRVLLVAALGAAYFAWRWSYFGLPLPLPLYVKGHAARESSGTAMLAGAGSVGGWFLHPSGGWPLLLALVLVLAIGGGENRGPRLSPLGIAAAPFLAHLAVLSFARQSQNAALRFEAPAQTALLCLLAIGAVRAMEIRGSSAMRCLVAVLALAGGAVGVVAGVKMLATYERLRTYVDVFGPRLGAILEPGDRVALGDQAGRIPYWTSARMFDLVGLNTERTALAPPDGAYLASLDPDVFLLYTGANTFDLPAMSGDVVPLRVEDLSKSVRPEFRRMYEHGIAQYGSTSIPDNACNVIAAKFLADSDRYDLYAVKYMASYKHVYALKRGFPRAPEILDALRASAKPEAYRSYAQVVGLPFAGT